MFWTFKNNWDFDPSAFLSTFVQTFVWNPSRFNLILAPFFLYKPKFLNYLGTSNLQNCAWIIFCPHKNFFHLFIVDVHSNLMGVLIIFIILLLCTKQHKKIADRHRYTLLENQYMKFHEFLMNCNLWWMVCLYQRWVIIFFSLCTFHVFNVHAVHI